MADSTDTNRHVSQPQPQPQHPCPAMKILCGLGRHQNCCDWIITLWKFYYCATSHCGQCTLLVLSWTPAPALPIFTMCSLMTMLWCLVTRCGHLARWRWSVVVIAVVMFLLRNSTVIGTKLRTAAQHHASPPAQQTYIQRMTRLYQPTNIGICCCREIKSLNQIN